MNILVCQNNKLLLAILPYIKLENFIIISSLLNLKILAKGHTINLVIYEDTLDLDARHFKNIKHILSFSEFVKQTTLKKNNKEEKKVNPNFNTKKTDKISTINTKDTRKIPNNENINKQLNIKTDIIKSSCNNHTSIVKASKKNIFNKIYTFTSVKGGVGVSSLIVELTKLKTNKLILDLGFIDGGSDLSYYLSLPQVPHIGTYLEDVPINNALSNNLLKINEHTNILQAPSSKKIYGNISSENISNLLSQNIGNVLIDIPFYSQYISDVLKVSTKLVIVTNGTPMEVNRINTLFNQYKNIITCVVVNPKEKNYEDYFSECDLNFVLYKNFIKSFS